MARKTRTHKRRRSTAARKHHRGHKHIKNCKCKCKYCCSAKKGSRIHTRSRRGGTQTAVGGDMIYKIGQWFSYNPLGGRS